MRKGVRRGTQRERHTCISRPNENQRTSGGAARLSALENIAGVCARRKKRFPCSILSRPVWKHFLSRLDSGYTVRAPWGPSLHSEQAGLSTKSSSPFELSVSLRHSLSNSPKRNRRSIQHTSYGLRRTHTYLADSLESRTSCFGWRRELRHAMLAVEEYPSKI